MTAKSGRHDAGARTPDGAAASVVVGVDGSRCASHAALWAANEAARRGTALTVAHAVDLPSVAISPFEPVEYADRRRGEGRAVLDQTAADVRARFPELPLDLELSNLSPGDALVAMSRTATVLVTGTRGRGGFAGMLLGSVTRTLAVHGHRPLVVARDGPANEKSGGVVLGAGRKPSSAAVRYAFDAARRYRVGLTVVRAWWRPGAVHATMTGTLRTPRDAVIDDARHDVEPFIAAFPDVDVEFIAPEANTVAALIRASQGARLLVVGAHRRRGRPSAGAGYVVDGVLGHAAGPVAVVPTP